MSPAASTRWCPTPEQVMILEEMYRGGVRTPNATQIQQITAHLSLYGKIEGKNVFYWFQNHKARDRQKLRKKLLGKQLQQQMLFSPFCPPCFDNTSMYQHFQHVSHNNNNNFLHHHHHHHNHLQSVPAPPLPPPCCGATPPSLGLFHQVPTLNSPCFSAHQGRAEDIVPQMTTNSYTWKLEASSNAKYKRENSRSGIMSLITNDHDDWRMMMRSRDHHHHDNAHDDDHNNHDDHDDDSTRRSLKTLELFPIKEKTSLKNDLTFV